MPDTTRPKLAQLIRDFIDSTESADRGQKLAEEVVASIPKKDHELYLVEAVRRLLPVLDNRIRAEAVQHVFRTEPSNKGKAAPASTKQTVLTNFWPEFLRQSLPTADGGRVLLGAATKDDLLFNATKRLESAEKLTAEAGKYQRLADLLDKTGKSKLADVPSDVVAAEFDK